MDNSGSKQNLLPSEVVVDLVLQYSAVMPIAGQAAVLKGSLLVAARNHLGQFASFGMPVHFDGDPFDGDAATPPRFVLRKIGATVWKLAPSIKHDLLHAFITIVDVPETVAWGTGRGAKGSHMSAPRREDMWLVVCGRCDKPKAPRGCVPVKDSEAKDYCMRSCPGYEEWPHPSSLPLPSTEGAA